MSNNNLNSSNITNNSIDNIEKTSNIKSNTGLSQNIRSSPLATPIINNNTIDTPTSTVKEAVIPTIKTTNNINNNINNGLPTSPLAYSPSEASPTSNSTTEKRRSFLFQHKTHKNKQRSFSLSGKSNPLKRVSNSTPNIFASSLGQLNSSPSLNNSSIIDTSSSSTSLSSLNLSTSNPLQSNIINRSEPSLCPEGIISSQPLRSESCTNLRPNKSETHINLLSSASSQQSHNSHHHHHLFFYSLDRHHSRHSSASVNPSLNNSSYSSSLAIPPHTSHSSLSNQIPLPSNSNNSSQPNNSNPEMLKKSSSRSTLTLNSTKSKDENKSSSPIPMGMSIDDYEVGAQIGNGSSAVVYVAKYKPSQKTVCLKVIDLDMFERNQIDGLRKEIQIMSLCKHENLLTVYGSFVHESKLYIVTPLLSAGSCLNIMKYAYPEGFEEVVIATILKQALLGLEYLHKNGLIHRDVKAGNLLMSEDGLVQLADFGVSSSLMETGERKGLRKTFVGTPCWMAPEVMEQSGYDYKADIWSFGITALEMATGRAPFAKYPPIKVLMLTIENEPPTLDRDQCRHKYSRTFKEMIDLCLNKDPSKRPTAEKLLQHPFFKQAKKKSYLAQTILHNVPSIQMRPLKVVKPKVVQDEVIDWDFDEDDNKSSNKVVKFATNSNSNSISNVSQVSSINSVHNSNSSILLEVPPLTPIKEDNLSPNSNRNFDLSINNHNNNTNNNKNTINNNNNINISTESIPSPPKISLQRNSSSELGYHSLPRSKGRFIIDTGENVHCESPASINAHSINANNRNGINSLNDNAGSSTSLKAKPLYRHLSLADRAGSHSNDSLIIEKRSRFELSHQTPTSTTEMKQSRFIITDGNNEGKRSRVIEVSEPPSRHSSNGSISSSNNSVNSNSYISLNNGEIETVNTNVKNINKKIEMLVQNSERQNKLLEMISSSIGQNKLIVRNSIYYTNEDSSQVLKAAETLMEKLNETLKELDYLKSENKFLKQDIEKANKLNGQLNQKLMALEQENLILSQKQNNS